MTARGLAAPRANSAAISLGRAFAPQREHRLEAARALSDRDRRAARGDRRRESGDEIAGQKRRIARRGRRAAKTRAGAQKRGRRRCR